MADNIYVTYQYNGNLVQYHQNIEEKEKLYNTCQKKKTKSIIGLAGEEEKRKHLVEKKIQWKQLQCKMFTCKI